MNTSERINKGHLDRMAIVYVRQSTDIQVKNNTASQLYQREQREHAVKYGWHESKIEIVEDLGQSGSISGNRDNYKHLLKRIDQGEIGAIFYHDQSRLSRNTLDFHILMTKCRIHDTLFVEDGRLLDPKDATDAFMAAIRADVAQLENLDRTKKMQDGAVARVKSGFAVRRPPVGYIQSEKGKWVKHPEQRVRDTIDLIFKLAIEMPSAYAVFQHFLEKKLLAPHGLNKKGKKTAVRWAVPKYQYIKRTLANPQYTPDYYFKRRVGDPKLGTYEGRSHRGRPKTRPADPDKILVVRDHHEGYISRDEFDKLREKHSKNAFKEAQPPQEGGNLLQGIIYCGHCKRRMSNRYPNMPQKHRYYGTLSAMKTCPAGNRLLDAKTIDDVVVSNVLEVIKSPLVQKAIDLYNNRRKITDNSHQVRQLQVQHLEQQAKAAEQAYLTADLKNDMVRKKLETIWQEQLMALENLKRQPEEIQENLPKLTVEQENTLRYLCDHFEEAFFHPSIDNRTRKRLIQCFLKKVVLQLHNDLIHLDLYWRDVDSSVATLTVQTPPYVYRYILSRYHQGLDEKAILKAMETDGIGLPGKVFTRLGIASYIKDRGLESCTVRKRKKIESLIRQFYQDKLNAEEITERLNSQGIRTITGAAFTLVNTEKILRRLIRQEQKSPRQIGAKNWSIIKKLMDQDLDTHEIVDELNARGLKTGTGLTYSYRNLRKVMRRQGHMPPRKKLGKMKTKLNRMFRECRSEGLSSRQAIEKAIKEGLLPADDTMARKRAYDCYRSLGIKGAVIENIPEDFRALIELLVSKGLDGPQIANELNRQGLKTIKGKSYQASTVQQYCRTLGISLRQKRYLDDPALKKEIMVFLDAGKSCKQIADHLNAHGFKTFLGRDFKHEDIRSLLSRQALKASDHCRYDYIIEAIRPLVDAGYHPRTIGGKLNSMGMKTITGQRFDTRKIKHYIRIMKSLDSQSVITG